MINRIDREGAPVAAADGTGSRAGDEPLLTAKQVEALLGEVLGPTGPKERTIYDWWGAGKMRYVPVGKRGKRTIRSWVEETLRHREQARLPVTELPPPPPPDPLSGETAPWAPGAPPPPPPPLAPSAPPAGGGADGGYPDARALEATARFICGPDAPEEEVVRFAGEVLEYRLGMPRLEPQTRKLLARRYFRWVKEAIADVAPAALTGALLLEAAVGG